MSKSGFKRYNCLVFLLLLAFLVPTAGWAQFYVRVPVKVTDNVGANVASAQVWLWDKYSPFPVNQTTGFTDADGLVTLNLTLVNFVPNKDAPPPNLGIFVLPNNGTTGTLAFQAKELLNFGSTDSGNPGITPQQAIQLPLGQLLTVNTRKGATDGPLVHFWGSLDIMSVPWTVFHFEVATATFSTYWAPGYDGFANAAGSPDRFNPDESSYLENAAQNFKVGLAPLIVNLVLPEVKKGLVTGTLTPDNVPFTIRFARGVILDEYGWNWDWHQKANAVGSYSFYLPPGEFAAKYDAGATYALHLETNIPVVANVTATRNVAVAAGSIISGTLKTDAGVGVPNYYDVVLKRELDFGGWKYKYVKKVQTNASGAYVFPRMEPGKYVIFSKQTGNGLGYVDTTVEPYKSYLDAPPTYFELTGSSGDEVRDLVMAQRAGVFGFAKYDTGLASGPLPNLALSASPVRFWVQDMGNEYFNTVVNASYDVNTGKYFLGFLASGSRVFGRAERAFTTDKVAVHVGAPTLITGIDTVALSDAYLKVTEANFVKVSGQVFIGSATTALQNGRVYLGALVPGVDSTKILSWFLQEHGLAGTPTYSFWVEKGMNYALTTKETMGSFLNGFADVNVPLNVAADSVDFTRDVTVYAGCTLVGKFRYNGDANPFASYPVHLTVGFLDQLPPGQYPPAERAGIITDGNYRVSGLLPGKHYVRANFDGITDHYTLFASQTKPLLEREFVLQPNQELALDINFQNELIGFVEGVVVDGQGVPIPGARVIIGHGPVPVFHCTTDSQGRYSHPVNSNKNQIPVEAGKNYTVTVCSLVQSAGNASFTYDFQTVPEPFEVFPQRITQKNLVLHRRYPFGVILKDGVNPIVNKPFNLYYKGDPRPPEYGYTDSLGEAKLTQGVPPGQYTLVIQVEVGSATRIYTRDFYVPEGQAFNTAFNFDPSELKAVNIKSFLGEGTPLPNANFEIRKVLDPTVGINGPTFPVSNYSGVQTDASGKLDLRLPPGMYGFFMRETANWTVDPPQFYIPGPPKLVTVADLDQDVSLNWQQAVQVDINVANLPAEADRTRYYAKLKPMPEFGKVFDPNGPMAPTQGGHVQMVPMAPMNDIGFSFFGVSPRPDMVLCVYEKPVSAPGMMAPQGVLRYVSPAPFAIPASPAISITLPALADLTVIASGAVTTMAQNGLMRVEFSMASGTTRERLVEPVVDGPPILLMFGSATIKLPARAYRVSLLPFPGSPMLPKIQDDVLLVPTGTSLTMAPKTMNKVQGTFGTGDSGEIMLFPEGAVVKEGDTDGIRPFVAVASGGNYEMFLSPGRYTGYAFSNDTAKAPQFLILEVKFPFTFYPIVFGTAATVSGKILVPPPPGSGSTNLPAIGIEYLVLRKQSNSSDLTDGQAFFPYPSASKGEIRKTAADGSFTLKVDRGDLVGGCDYYILPLVPNGFRPEMPRKFHVAAFGDLTIPDIILGNAGAISGRIDGLAKIEAVPLTRNALTEEIGDLPMSFPGDIDTTSKDASGTYSFKIPGLDPSLVFQLLVKPQDLTKAVQVFGPFHVGAGNVNIVLQPGYTLYGNLLNEAGVALPQANVSVNLMTMVNGLPYGFWVNTNSYGRFEFRQVPPVKGIGLKTENGFLYDGVNYGVTRTPPFDMMATDTVHNIVLGEGGHITGKVVDVQGRPMQIGWVQVHRGDLFFETPISSGSFTFYNLPPAPDYNLRTDETPGYPPVRRVDVPVLPGKTTDVGLMKLVPGVIIETRVQGFATAALLILPQGLPQDSELGVVGVRHGADVKLGDLLGERALEHVVGFAPIFWDPVNPPDIMPVRGFFAAGPADFALTLARKYPDGKRWRLLSAWRHKLTLPTLTQLGSAPWQIGDFYAPQEWGKIKGTITNKVASMTFNPGDSAVLLYKFDATTKDIEGTPVPHVIAIPNNGEWLVEFIPAGVYKAAVVSRQMPRFFYPFEVVIAASESKVLDIVIDKLPCELAGKVVDGSTGSPLENVKAELNGEFATLSRADGTFKFYVPPRKGVVAVVRLSKAGLSPTQLIKNVGDVVSGTYDLGVASMTTSVMTFEGTVEDKADSTPIVGARVRMIHQANAQGPFIPGKIHFTDEDGKFVIEGVPAGIPLIFHAKAEGYRPSQLVLGPYTKDTTATATIQLEARPVMAFYQGFLVPASTPSATLRKLIGHVEFNKVVTKSLVKFWVGATDKTSIAAFPDEIDGLVTFCHVEGEIDLTGAPDIKVEYNGVVVGTFPVDIKAGFQQRVDVDPFQSGEFSANLKDQSGKKLPTGVKIPEGMLPKDVKEFNVKQSIGSGTCTAVGDSGNITTTYGGPIYEFDFGVSGIGSTTSTVQDYLFEVTIQYTATDVTKLEPRWYDKVTQTWSKVGIASGSVQWDVPEAGYVTFKVTHLTEFAVLNGLSGTGASYRCDFDGNGKINLADAVYMLGWINSGRSTDKATIKAEAALLYPVTADVVNVPSLTLDDLDGDGKIKIDDAVFAIGWINSGRSTVKNTIETEAKLLYTVGGSLANVPGDVVER